MTTKEEDGRAPRIGAGGYPARSDPYAEALVSPLIATLSGITPVSTQRHSAISSFLAIATIAIRRVRPCNVPTRSRNHVASVLSG